MPELVPASALATGQEETVESAFARLNVGVQRQLWRMQWQYLRPLQVQAIHSILTTENPVLLCAATAAGKTEAAFLPILSRLLETPGEGVQALYVGPLRALINDQFERMEVLCEDLHIPVHRWHGDVGATAKKKLVDKPGGILLLTPESLESLFINRSPRLQAIFGNLQFIVIDEAHVFLGTERGRHLQSLLTRLEAFTQQPARRIGLSATVAKRDELALVDDVARRLLNPDSPEQVICIDDSAQKPLGYAVYGFLDRAYFVEEEDGEPEQEELVVEREIATKIAAHFSGLTSLVFANARGAVESYGDLARGLMPNNDIVVHHGSLARNIREDAEWRLKASGKSRAVTAFCSSTLELGIDLGDVAVVGQIGAPPSVASLKQRLGRSGRGEGEKRVLRVYLDLKEPTFDDELFDRVHLPLIQTIAATQLMLEGWVEPAREASCDLSTLTQQIISVIAQTGGIGAATLYKTLCSRGAFTGVEAPLFAKLLRCLGLQENDVIEQTPKGELILGLRGETIRKGRDFYAVFPTPEQYAVAHDGHLLGHLPMTWAPPPGEHLLFAGRRWLVTSVEEARRQIHVKPASGKKKPHFSGEDAEVHPRLRQKMREVLLGAESYHYLDEVAKKLLADARGEAAQALVAEKTLLPLGNGRTALQVWTGDRLDASIRLLLLAVGADLSRDRNSQGVAIMCRHSEEELRTLLLRAATLQIESEELAKQLKEKRRRKYDGLLTDELLEISLARDWVDVTGAQEMLAGICGQHLPA